MKSLINECLVLTWVIDRYKNQNKDNPCSLCEYASEHCLSYLKNGYVPLTGEKIIEPPVRKTPIVEETKTSIPDANEIIASSSTPVPQTTNTTSNKRTQKCSTKKSKKKRKGR